MPLSVTNIATGNVIQAVDVSQFYSLLTGAMTDQAVTLKNQVIAGSAQATNQVPLTVQGVNGQTADLFDVKQFGGTVAFGVSAAGAITFAGGLTVNTGGISVTGTSTFVSGGVQIQAGGLVITAGGLSVSAGGMALNGTLNYNGNNLSTGAFGAFTPWTVGITQGATTPSFTNQGSTYQQIGKLVIASCNVTATSAGSAGNDIIISSLPVAPKLSGQFVTVGAATYFRTGVTPYVGSAIPVSSTNVKFVMNNGTGGYLGNANGPSFAVANGDVISFLLVYESS